MSRLRPSRSGVVAFFNPGSKYPTKPIFDIHFEGIRRIPPSMTCPELFPRILLLFYCY